MPTATPDQAFGDRETVGAPAWTVEHVMPGCTDQSREYLCRAVEHDQRAAKTVDPKLKATLLSIAQGYRKLAEQLDARWRPPLATDLSRQKHNSAA
jgi:hypothetical protein